MNKKLKQCTECKKDVIYYKNKLCLSCFKKLNPEKFLIKKSVSKHKSPPKTTIKKTPLKKSQKAISKFSQKQIGRQKQYQKLRLELLEKFPICTICNKNPATEIHHARGRGLFLLEHLIPTCRPCHLWCHQNVEEATKLGYIISRIKN